MPRKTPLRNEAIEPEVCSLDLRIRLLTNLPFFAGLSSITIEEISRCFTERGYQPGETIYHEGDLTGRLHVVASGKVKTIRHTLGGQDVVLDILTQGEFFGSLPMLGDREYQESSEAQTSCCILSVASEDFQTLLDRYPPVTLNVLQIVTTRLQDAHEKVKQLSAYPVEQRIAAALLKLAEKLGDINQGHLLIQTPLSRQDLAALTGTTTETVSRVLSQFRKDGLIHSGRQWIAISDLEALKSLVTDQYRG